MLIKPAMTSNCRSVTIGCCGSSARPEPMALARCTRWLDQRDVLIVKADRREPLVILRLSLAMQIVKAGSGTNVGLR